MNTQLTIYLLPLLAATALTTSAPARAADDDGAAIVKKARCVACHTVDEKRVGPAYKDVAARYQGNTKAPAILFDKVRQGGSGTWGEIPMIPHPADKISDGDLKAAIHWILSLN